MTELGNSPAKAKALVGKIGKWPKHNALVRKKIERVAGIGDVDVVASHE